MGKAKGGRFEGGRQRGVWWGAWWGKIKPTVFEQQFKNVMVKFIFKIKFGRVGKNKSSF